MKKIIPLSVFAISLLAGCNGQTQVKFSYEKVNFTPLIGETTNNEVYDYDDIIVNKIPDLREDFAMGVDASMILKVEEQGGKYFNENGQEQDVYQIMANNGVNFFRVRIWNNPFDKYHNGYGGGDVDTDRAILMAKRAQNAGMNVMVDLHYSDFWADPDTQTMPKAWASKTSEELIEAVEQFTSQVLLKFKNAGVGVQAIQIGNEINNGLLWEKGKIDWSNINISFDYLVKLLKAGIKGAKSVNKNIYTVLHLANGGSKDLFNDYFGEILKRKVDFDIVGASYYPYYHGTLAQLQETLDLVANKFNKPVIVAEMSYGYTNASHPYAANTYSSQMEEAGKFLTSLQGQATAIHDVVEVLSRVPKKLGLGIFYWEPAWLPIQGAGWANVASGLVNSDGLSSWANQALFSYSGKVLPSLQTFKLLKDNSKQIEEKSLRIKNASINVTLNKAAHEVMPKTYSVVTNLDAIRQYPVVWNSSDINQLDEIGSYTVSGLVDNKYPVQANVTVIENFVVDPGYELQGETDKVLPPWIIEYSTPVGSDVVKLNRKPQDVRTGNSDLNWYHGSQNFTFKVKQTITLEQGTYTLRAYLMAIKPSEIPHSRLDVYIKVGNNNPITKDMKNQILGWGTPESFYVEALIDEIVVLSKVDVEIGLIGEAGPGAWGHIDDWTLVRK